MVELIRRSSHPPKLVAYISTPPGPNPADFDGRTPFTRHGGTPPSPKDQTKAYLNADQGGICVYCEQQLAPNEGHLEHIKPKSAYPLLTFDYTNLAQSCQATHHCGHNKSEATLPFEPGPGCNAKWTLVSATGAIDAISGLSPADRHAANQTYQILGLNKAPLPDARLAEIGRLKQVLAAAPHAASAYFASTQFRFILRRLGS